MYTPCTAYTTAPPPCNTQSIIFAFKLQLTLSSVFVVCLILVVVVAVVEMLVATLAQWTNFKHSVFFSLFPAKVIHCSFKLLPKHIYDERR